MPRSLVLTGLVLHPADQAGSRAVCRACKAQWLKERKLRQQLSTPGGLARQSGASQCGHSRGSRTAVALDRGTRPSLVLSCPPCLSPVDLRACSQLDQTLQLRGEASALGLRSGVLQQAAGARCGAYSK